MKRALQFDRPVGDPIFGGDREIETSAHLDEGAEAQVYLFPYSMQIGRLIEHDRTGAARSLLSHALSQGSPTPDLLKWQEVFAPPRVRKSKKSDRSPDFRESGAYSGQWVAILCGELVAHAASLKDLLAQLEEAPPAGRPLVFRVGSEKDQAHNEVPLFPKRGGGMPVSMELVNRLRDEE